MEKVNCIICGKHQSTPFKIISDRLSNNNQTFELVKCDCSLVYLNPRIDMNNIGTFYRDNRYHPHNLSELNYWNKLYNIAQSFTMIWKYNKILKFKKKGKILDIGGGKGEFATFMSSKGWDVVMQDNYSMIEDNSNNKFRFVRNLNSIKETTNFDVIAMWHSLEHIHDIEALYNQIVRMLSPGGVLLIAIPNLNAPEKLYYDTHWAPFDAPRHLYHFNLNSLTRLCSKYNFKILRKFSLYQDTPYNILLSIRKINLLQIIKAFFVFFVSITQPLFKGPDRSSSILVFCKKT